MTVHKRSNDASIDITEYKSNSNIKMVNVIKKKREESYNTFSPVLSLPAVLSIIYDYLNHSHDGKGR